MYSEVDSFPGRPSFIDSNALVPAGVIRGDSAQLQREVGEGVCPWVQASVLTPSEPGEVEADRADDMAGEDGVGARGGGDVTLDCDGRRGLCRTTVQQCSHSARNVVLQRKVRIQRNWIVFSLTLVLRNDAFATHGIQPSMQPIWVFKAYTDSSCFRLKTPIANILGRYPIALH